MPDCKQKTTHLNLDLMSLKNGTSMDLIAKDYASRLPVTEKSKKINK